MTEVQDNVVRSSGILLISYLEQLLDANVIGSQVDRYELIVGKGVGGRMEGEETGL